MKNPVRSLVPTAIGAVSLLLVVQLALHQVLPYGSELVVSSIVAMILVTSLFAWNAWWLHRFARDRSTAEQRAHESEQRFRLLTEYSLDVVVIVDPTGLMRYVSPASTKLFGYRPDEIVGMPPDDYEHPDDMATIRAARACAMAQPGVAVGPITIRVRHRDGSWRHIEVMHRNLTHEPSIRGMATYSHDVTDRVCAENELVASVHLLEAIIEGTTDAMFVKDRSGSYRMMNAAGAAMLGTVKQEVIGKTDRDVFPPEEAARVLCADERVIASEQPLTMEESFAERDGHVRTYLTTKSPWRDAAGRVRGVIGIAHDITEWKRTEAALTYARDQALDVARLKSEFMANLSHEIRTPMNAVIGFTDMVLDSDVTAQQRDLLSSVRSSAEKLLALLTDMLDLSKIQTGTAKLEHESVDVRELVGEAAGMFRAMAQRKGLALTSDVAPDVPDRVLGDRARLRQALVNLIENAVKFTAEGRVAVRACSELGTAGEAGMHFTIADTGIGIPVEKQQVIFDSFVQVDGSMSRRYGGSGLGLTIASQAVALMGGTLWVESAEGRGSTFHFTAPLVSERIMPTGIQGTGSR